jgi:hypothetical protein
MANQPLTFTPGERNFRAFLYVVQAGLGFALADPNFLETADPRVRFWVGCTNMMVLAFRSYIDKSSGDAAQKGALDGVDVPPSLAGTAHAVEEAQAATHRASEELDTVEEGVAREAERENAGMPSEAPRSPAQPAKAPPAASAALHEPLGGAMDRLPSTAAGAAASVTPAVPIGAGEVEGYYVALTERLRLSEQTASDLIRHRPDDARNLLIATSGLPAPAAETDLAADVTGAKPVKAAAPKPMAAATAGKEG